MPMHPPRASSGTPSAARENTLSPCSPAAARRRRPSGRLGEHAGRRRSRRPDRRHANSQPPTDHLRTATAWGVNAPNINVYERLTHVDENFQLRPETRRGWELRPRRPDVALLSAQRGDVPRRFPVHRQGRDLQRRSRRAAGAGRRDQRRGRAATTAVDNHTVNFAPPRAPTSRCPSACPTSPNHVHIIKAGAQPVGASDGYGSNEVRQPHAGRVAHKVERYDGYWDKPDTARVRSILFKFIPDGNARVLALRAGNVNGDHRRAARGGQRAQAGLQAARRPGPRWAGSTPSTSTSSARTSSPSPPTGACARRWRWASTATRSSRTCTEGDAAAARLVTGAARAAQGQGQGPARLRPCGRATACSTRWAGVPAPTACAPRTAAGWRSSSAAGFPLPEVAAPPSRRCCSPSCARSASPAQIVEQSMANLVVNGSLRAHFWLEELYGATDPGPGQHPALLPQPRHREHGRLRPLGPRQQHRQRGG